MHLRSARLRRPERREKKGRTIIPYTEITRRDTTATSCDRIDSAGYVG
jgi:hypothetical protein